MKKIKRKISLILTFAIICVSLFSCSDDGSDAKFVTPVGMEVGEVGDGYVFFIPEGWVLQEKINGVVLAYASSADKTSVSLAVDTAPSLTVDEYFQASLSDFSKYPDLKIESSNTLVLLGTQSARSYVYTFTKNETEYKVNQIFSIINDKLYTLTYLAKTENKLNMGSYYDENYESFDKVRSEFLFTDISAEKNEYKTFEAEVPVEGMKLISDKSIVKYDLFVPNSYTVDLQGGATCAHADDGSSVCVSYIIPESSTLKDYWDLLKERYGLLYEDFTEQGEETVKIGNYDTILHKYTAKYAGTELTYNQYFMIRGSYVYTLTLCAKSECFASHTEEFSDIISHFNLR